jgi:hypothetical protein
MKQILLYIGLAGLLISCNNKISEDQIQVYEQKGKQITAEVFETLSEQLTQQMQIGGTLQAIPYCNVTAVPVTRDLSDEHGVTIKRTSDLIRNPKNSATKRELDLMMHYKKLESEGNPLKAIIEKDTNEIVHFYAPIKLQKKCLACHGTVGKELTVKTDSILNELYPEDRAKGYSEGDLRGIWSIAFKN